MQSRYSCGIQCVERVSCTTLERVESLDWLRTYLGYCNSLGVNHVACIADVIVKHCVLGLVEFFARGLVYTLPTVRSTL